MVGITLPGFDICVGVDEHTRTASNPFFFSFFFRFSHLTGALEFQNIRFLKEHD